MDIKEFISSLSKSDKKTLSQKVLKTAEEVGELARVILPFDSASGTNHRFVTRADVLEEIVDIHLCNTSILYSMGFSEEEFNEMLYRKTKKWSKLQVAEKNAEFPLPFEIHITIQVSDYSSEGFDINKFRNLCEENGIKPIILDLELNDRSTLKDVMTSSKYFGDNRGAHEACEIISDLLGMSGYRVVRKKIETVPWHPASPPDDPVDILPNGCYFESHIGVSVDKEDKEKLDKLVDHMNNSGRYKGTLRSSRNFFKKSSNGRYINMLTYRNNLVGSVNFESDVKAICESLDTNHLSYEKVEVEYAIYDSNKGHDSKWLLK